MPIFGLRFGLNFFRSHIVETSEIIILWLGAARRRAPTDATDFTITDNKRRNDLTSMTD